MVYYSINYAGALLMTCRKRSESSETVSSIQPDSQPANAVPPILEKYL